MEPTSTSFIYVLQSGPHNRVSGVFSTKESAIAWIRKHALTGLLTQYVIDDPSYERAQRIGRWRAKEPRHSTAEFIADFGPPDEHWHFVQGIGEGEEGFGALMDKIES